jgi:quercetin dioxygenase-like cupin family protein
MSSIDRQLTGDVLVIDLDAERARTTDPAALERSGRSARTLLKGGSLTVTLVSIAAGGTIAEHQAEGTITLQPLDGSIRFMALGTEYELAPGQLLSAAPGVRHTVSSDAGGSFLLTVGKPA